MQNVTLSNSKTQPVRTLMLCYNKKECSGQFLKIVLLVEEHG